MKLIETLAVRSGNHGRETAVHYFASTKRYRVTQTSYADHDATEYAVDVWEATGWVPVVELADADVNRAEHAARVAHRILTEPASR